MIASGEKKEEYREIKKYWIRRFCGDYWHGIENDLKKQPAINVGQEDTVLDLMVNKFDAVKFTNGYAKNAPSIMVECKGIEIGKAVPEWSDNWQGEVFVIKLGNIIK